MQQFRAIKHLWLKAVLAKFKIFAQVFLTTFDSATQTFVPLVKLSRPSRENISTFIKGTLKTLFDAVKRKSTLFFNGSGKTAKPKHQDMMDELLQSVYPVYSLAREFSNPYTVVRDESEPWSGQKIDLQIDPVYLPSSEDRAALCQVASVLIEDTLVPLFVYLWRDERNLFLRRQSSVVKFAITHAGPNSILQISILCNKIRSRNTRDPIPVSSSLPGGLMTMEELFQLVISSSINSQNVFRDIARLGDLQLHALGIDLNVQNQLGQTLLHLAVVNGKTDTVSCLLSAGAMRHITDNSGLTPLMVAVHGAEMMEGEHTAENIVRLLVTGDSRLDLPDTSGRTVLHLAAMIQSSGERRLRQRLTSILVEAGAGLVARDIHGDYPVDLCFRISETTLFD